MKATQMDSFLASTTSKHVQREETIGAIRRVTELSRGCRLATADGTPIQPLASSATVPRPVVSLKTLYTDFEVRELPAFYGHGAPLRLELDSSTTTTATTPTTTASATGGVGDAAKVDKAAQAATAVSDESGNVKRSRESDSEENQNSGDIEIPRSEAQEPHVTAPSYSVVETIGPLVSADDLAALLSGLAAETKSIPLPSVVDKESRGQLHAAIKACLGATHVSSTVDGVVCVVKANAADRREERRRSRTQRPPPKYHHFTLYKENTDSNQALRMIAAHLRLSSRQLQFCGTKDKRAVTLQRVAIRETTVERLKSINDRIFGLHNVIKVCGFTQEGHGLRLGDARGNHFRIALRVFPGQTYVSTSMQPSASVLTADYLQEVERVVRTYGVINYFGPQRFGTTAVLTSDVGVQFLRGNLREGLRLLLASKATIVPEMAKAVELFEGHKYTEALQATPYYCYQERDVLKHLSTNPNDYLGALQAMARTMAMMYFHAVQSLVWNRVASSRLSGSERMQAEVGDLVYESTYQERLSGTDAKSDDAYTLLAMAEDDDAAATDPKMPTVRKLVSAGECARFTLADVLLPVPGPDQALLYPESAGCSRADYAQVLQELQIDFESPHTLSLIKIFHFHGTYRALGVRPTDFELRLETAASWRAPVLRSDWELYCAQEHVALPPPTTVAEAVAACEPQGEIQVMVAAFSLPPGSYATSVIREFCIPSTDGFPGTSNEAEQED
jgi:tRNA pseudouridine13 synthase